MFRRWLLIAIVALLAPSALDACGCSVPRGRALIGGARLVAIVTDISETELRIDAVLHGTASGRTLPSISGSGCVTRERGQSFLAAEHCVTGECYLSLVPMDAAADDLAFLHGRHFVRRADVLAELAAWQSGSSTARFLRWISMADTEEVDREMSLTIPLIEALQTTAGDIDRGEREAPELTAAMLRSPLARLIERVELLPPEETEEDYEPVCRSNPDAIPWDVHWQVLDDALGELYDSAEYGALFEKLYPFIADP